MDPGHTTPPAPGALDARLGIGFRVRGEEEVWMVNPCPTTKDNTDIVRDPRDVIVSRHAKNPARYFTSLSFDVREER